MSRHKVQKSSVGNYSVSKKSNPLTQTRPWTNSYQQRNDQAEQQPASTAKPPTTEEWMKNNVLTKAIETTRQAQLQQQGIQAKLTVGEPGDRHEQEADRMASRIMSMPDTAVQRTSEPQVQTQPLAYGITPLVQRAATPINNAVQANGDLEHRLNSSKSGGSPLPDNVRNFMEPRFGADFSRVRVYTDSTAVQMSRELGAQAFTHGSDIYYGEGKAPGNNELTAHELTHTIQQTGGVQAKLATPQPTRPTYPSNHSSTTFHSSQRIGSSTRLALRPTTLPPVPNAILRQTLQRKVGQKLLWRKFWQVVGKRFGVKIAAAGTAAIADGPLPIGDLISIGLTIWMIWDLIQLWDMLWEEATKELEQEQERVEPRAIPRTIPQERDEKLNTMRFQVQWNTNGGGPTFSQVVTAPSSKGVTTAQAITALEATVASVTPDKAQKAALPAKVKQIAWISSRPPAGIATGGYSKSQYFRYKDYTDARVDVENMRGHNLRV